MGTGAENLRRFEGSKLAGREGGQDTLTPDSSSAVSIVPSAAHNEQESPRSLFQSLYGTSCRAQVFGLNRT